MRRFLRTFKLLPTTMFVAVLLLGMKVGGVVRDGERIRLQVASTATAETKPADEKPAEETPAAEHGGEEKKSEEKADAAPVDPAKAAAEAEAKKQEELAAAEALALSQMQPEERRYSEAELEMLQQLSTRREELIAWEKNVQLKENLLSATEQRIDKKVAQIEELRGELTQLIAQYNNQEDTKVKSLVKIYENMKPKDAARIFEEMDMPILLLVVDKMNEKKTAPVLAAMDPKKAKQVTQELAQQRKLKDKLLAATAPPASKP